jgi:hypothetical protein
MRLDHDEPDLQGADAHAFLLAEHARIRRALRDAVESCRERAAPRAPIDRCVLRMQVHDTLEEELLYPLAAMSGAAPDLLARAALDHTIMNALMTELQSSLASPEERARVLEEITERFERHACEEEEVLLPTLAESDLDLVELGADFVRRRNELVRALARFGADALREPIRSSIGRVPALAR